MKKYFLYSVIASLTIAACGTADTSTKTNDTLKLVFNPESGKGIKMNYEFTVNSVSQNNKLHFTLQMTGVTTKKSDNEIGLDITNNNSLVDGNVNGKEISYKANDSIPSDIKMVTTSVFSLNGKIFNSVYNSRLEKLEEKLQSDTAANSDPVENKMQFFIVYPDSAIKIGDNWKKQFQIKSGNKMNCDATYTLKSITDGKATIDLSGKLDGNGETFGHEFKIDGNLTGTIIVEVATGWPIETNIKQNFKLDLNGQILPMEYIIKHTVSQ
jgi:hypothetical protein